MDCRIKYLSSFIAALLFCAGCGNGSSSPEGFGREIYVPSHASGFSIYGSDEGGSSIIKVTNPWQGAAGIESYLMVRRFGEKIPDGVDLQVVDYPVRRVVCLSSSHVAFLEALSLDSLVAGVSGKRFICSSPVRERDVAEVGYDDSIDYELMLSLDCDLVLLYGVNGKSGAEKKLREIGIPYLYIGEYLEEDPLGRAEWIVAVGEATGCRVRAEDVFKSISRRYDHLKDSLAASHSGNVSPGTESCGKTAPTPRKKVMLNTPYGDNWFLPSEKSYMVRLIEDASGEYIHKGNKSSRSTPVDLEKAVSLLDSADIWLNVDAPSLESLTKRLPQVEKAPCVRSGMVFNCDKRTNESGGNDFWESAVVRPDIVLKDIAAILEGSDDELFYYRRLK